MTATKFLDPKNDFAFKKIFGTEKSKSILIHFLNDILGFPEGEKIKQVTFLKTVLDPEVAAKKQSIVDVLCVDEKGVQYIVEMQVARTDSFAKRAQYYAAKAYVNQMNNGDTYEKLKQIIFLAITDFVMFPRRQLTNPITSFSIRKSLRMISKTSLSPFLSCQSLIKPLKNSRRWKTNGCIFSNTPLTQT